ncbi:MAG: MaoC family dehydratase N-terminal domain-containing protein [Rhodococcus fascians]
MSSDTTTSADDVLAKAGKDFDHAIKDEDIDRAKLLIGYDTAGGMQEYYSEASRDAIRNFAVSYGDDNPLFSDFDYGANTRWGGQIAPGMIINCLGSPTFGDPLPEDLRKQTKGLFSGVHVFVSGQSTEWFRPIRPGDELYSFGGTESVEEKKSEFAGRSVIRVHRTVRVDQHGEIVAINRMLAIMTERKESRERGKYMDIEAASYTPEDIAAIDEIYAQEQRRGAEPRYFEDVEVGESMPKMAKGPFTLTDVISFHSGGSQLRPYGWGPSRLWHQSRQRIPKFYIDNSMGIPDVAQRLHWESEWSQLIGNPMAYDYGIMRECWLNHYLSDWVGDDGWVFRQHDEMRKFNYIGDTHFITGEVTSKRVEDGRCFVELEIRATNQRDVVTAPGNATVMLPSREHGPVVLPEPPVELRAKAVEIMERHNQIAVSKRAKKLAP